MSHYRSIADDNLINVLRLIRTLNVGPVTFFQLIERFGTAGSALEKIPEMAARGGRKTPLLTYDKSRAMCEIEQTEKFGARMILYGAPDYPKLLMECADAPPILVVAGHAHLWEKDCIAMVGARNASAAGCQLAQKLARELAESGLCVVSGLARGIDSFVHKGALTAGTVGVIAGGIDTMYPPENQMLYAQMREMGAIISEQPLGQAPFSTAFPARNRIIAGMALATLVVEASPKSGSLITARLAGEYGREVMAVPGSPLDPRSKGGNQLIKQGASMIESAEDVLSSLRSLRAVKFEEHSKPYYAGFAENKKLDEDAVEDARKQLLAKLSLMPVAIDELIQQTDIPAPLILSALLELELAGCARRSAGGKVALVVEQESYCDTQ
ncbi:MAG: DNA-processing protein DprA [Rickettsiales bacterium]|jgi:DNA processing protein|nr:DNA-processing protein DprA [Rickettsiales bacterium]